MGATSVANEAAQEPPVEQVEGEHENPMYTAYQKMQPEERQVSATGFPLCHPPVALET